MLCSSNLPTVLLCEVALLEDLLLTERSVVVEVELGVDSDDPAILGLGEGVDFDHGGVRPNKQLVQSLHVGRRSCRRGRVGELHPLGNGGGEGGGHALVDRDGLLDDDLGVLLRNVLNGHTTHRTGDHHRTEGLSIHHDRKVLLRNCRDLLYDEYLCTGPPSSIRLLRDQIGPDHVRSTLLGLAGSVNKVNARFVSVVEVSEPAPARKHLRFYSRPPREVATDFFRLCGTGGDVTLGSIDLELAHELHALVFMQVEVSQRLV
mmetsp:Transcript_26380/g.62727  ORF Transcript_26380/g.62727 Transcript_26380/m.62727 type:complete len:262 (+) Transcript_26380:1414-2199(+)